MFSRQLTPSRSQDFSVVASKIRGRGQARPEEPKPEASWAESGGGVWGKKAFPGISVASGHVPVAKYFSAIHHVKPTVSSCNRFFYAKPRHSLML